MAMNSLQLKGILVDKDKDSIIKRYKRGVLINIIAGKYNVGVDTIARRLRSWGVKVRKGDYHRDKTAHKHWYRKFSKNFIKNRAALSKRYGDKIRYPRDINRTSDQRLIRNILNKAFI